MNVLLNKLIVPHEERVERIAEGWAYTFRGPITEELNYVTIKDVIVRIRNKQLEVSYRVPEALQIKDASDVNTVFWRDINPRLGGDGFVPPVGQSGNINMLRGDITGLSIALNIALAKDGREQMLLPNHYTDDLKHESQHVRRVLDVFRPYGARVEPLSSGRSSRGTLDQVANWRITPINYAAERDISAREMLVEIGRFEQWRRTHFPSLDSPFA